MTKREIREKAKARKRNLEIIAAMVVTAIAVTGPIWAAFLYSL